MKVTGGAYFDSFSAFGFGCATGTGAFTTFDENSPAFGGFGLPRTLITSHPSSPDAQESVSGRPPLAFCAPRLSQVRQAASALRFADLLVHSAWRVSSWLTGSHHTPAAASYAADGEAFRMKPIRIRRERRAGYNMQRESLAINGRPCIFVGRPTKFGNPFKLEIFGRDLALELYRNAIHGIWHPGALFHQHKLREQAHAAHVEFGKRFDGSPLDAVRDELRGYNLACYCCLAHECHADDLLLIANGDA
jgi:Domain of unknown function (DUF4326)